MLYKWKKIISKSHKLMCPHLYRITPFSISFLLIKVRLFTNFKPSDQPKEEIIRKSAKLLMNYIHTLETDVWNLTLCVFILNSFLLLSYCIHLFVKFWENDKKKPKTKKQDKGTHDPTSRGMHCWHFIFMSIILFLYTVFKNEFYYIFSFILCSFLKKYISLCPI